MANLIIFNPYSKIGDTWLPGGFESIILGSTTTLDEINATICSYIKDTLGITSSDISDEELSSYVPLAVNGYINNDIGLADKQQQFYFSMLLHGIMRSTYSSIPNFIDEIEKNVTENLSTSLQIPLLIAISIARGSYYYWDDQVNNLTTGSWHTKLSSIDYINRTNVPKWVVASIQAAVWGYSKGSSNYSIDNAPQIAGASYPTVLAACLGVTSGLILFNWQKNIKGYSPTSGDKFGDIYKKDIFENLSRAINRKDAEGLTDWCLFCKDQCTSCVSKCTSCTDCITGDWLALAEITEY